MRSLQTRSRKRQHQEKYHGQDRMLESGEKSTFENQIFRYALRFLLENRYVHNTHTYTTLRYCHPSLVMNGIVLSYKNDSLNSPPAQRSHRRHYSSSLLPSIVSGRGLRCMLFMQSRKSKECVSPETPRPWRSTTSKAQIDMSVSAPRQVTISDRAT